MKKQLFAAVICVLSMLLSVSPVLANGTVTQPLASFEITSGLPKETESTFDTSRTIIGLAERNSVVTIVVSYLSGTDDQKESETEDYYEITVGASGMFSQSIDLHMGENTVSVTASKGKCHSEKVAVIKRKDKEIKLELEQGLALPGQNIR